MKKILCLILSLVMLFTLFACQKNHEIEENIPENDIEEIVDENIPEETPDIPDEEKEEEKEVEEKEDVSSTPAQKPAEKPADKVETVPEQSKPDATPTPEEKPQTPPAAEEKPSADNKKTNGDIMLSIFRENSSKSIEEIANACIADSSVQFMAMTTEVEPGFFAEFGGDLSGFDKGVRFGPAMGSIAFSGFVFEVSGDASAFAAELRKKADPRWNICVEADQIVSDVSGNKVFFLMCPSTYEM